MSPRILCVDDDLITLRLLRLTLESVGMDTVQAADGPEALEVWRRERPDLVLLDVAMPGQDGFQVCREIRQASDVPILMLTAMTEEANVIQGFEAGADDYITKPFRPNELVARVQAILQRMERLAAFRMAGRPAAGLAPGPVNGRLVHGDLELDLRGQRIIRRGRPVPATPLELQLLHYLMDHAGAAVSKEDLFREVWGYSLPAGGLNLIEVAVRRLREKIEDDASQPRHIRTVRGVGYRFEA
jgi:two-component system response regulator MtrA